MKIYIAFLMFFSSLTVFGADKATQKPCAVPASLQALLKERFGECRVAPLTGDLKQWAQERLVARLGASATQKYDGVVIGLSASQLNKLIGAAGARFVVVNLPDDVAKQLLADLMPKN